MNKYDKEFLKDIERRLNEYFSMDYQWYDKITFTHSVFCGYSAEVSEKIFTFGQINSNQ